MLVLTVIQGPDRGKRFELPDNEPQMIGRSSESLPLTDTSISRRHAELTPSDGLWLVNDLKSAHGTFVNGRRISEQTRLLPGDQLRVGSTLFVYGRQKETRTAGRVRVLSSEHIDSAVAATVAADERGPRLAGEMVDAEARGHLSVIYEMMQLTGSVFDRQAMLERVMDLVFTHFTADRGFILLREHGMDELDAVVVRHRAKVKKEERVARIAVSRTIVQHVLKFGEGVLSSNAMSDKRFSSGDSVHAYGIRSALCVPIKYRKKIHGVIYVDSRVADHIFDEEQLRLLTAIGLLAGMTLANTELYQSDMQRTRLAAVGETVASLTHSIRNILQAIRGGAEVVELGLRKDDIQVVTNGWDILRRNLDRIYDLTMNMLAFSKQRQPEFEVVNLPSLLHEIVELMSVQCDRKEVALLTECDAEPPPIPADSSGLHQALMNLLSNALDAVDSKTGVITLRCDFDAAAHEVSIEVSDNGKGVDPEDMKRLFTPFYSTKGLRGTGLGLAVTQKIIEEHGGRVEVESEPGEGTTFRIVLSSEMRTDPSATHARLD